MESLQSIKRGVSQLEVGKHEGRAPLLHVAIIMDGNRRWAKKQGLPLSIGHLKGAEALSTVVKAAADQGIRVLTVYAFSTENWHRSPEEVRGLMTLFKLYLQKESQSMVKEGVRLSVIGERDSLPQDVQRVIEETILKTEGGERIDLVLAINYGARDDICRAVRKVATLCKQEKLKVEEITEEVLSSHLDTAKWGDPDLLIRTSGEKRLSNFLLWQISYAEVYITDVLWPDFGKEELLMALADYRARNRRVGV